jgi:hypothetical protein
MFKHRSIRRFAYGLSVATLLFCGGCKYLYHSFTTKNDKGDVDNAYYCFSPTEPEILAVANKMFDTLRERAAKELGTKPDKVAYTEGEYDNKALGQLPNDKPWYCYQFFKPRVIN